MTNKYKERVLTFLKDYCTFPARTLLNGFVNLYNFKQEFGIFSDRVDQEEGLLRIIGRSRKNKENYLRRVFTN